MTDGKLIPNMTALELLDVLRNNLAEDNPTSVMVHAIIKSVAAELMLLHEVEIAALALADMVVAPGPTVKLPTADSEIIKRIRIFQR